MVADVVGHSVDGVLDGVLDGLEIVSVLVLKDTCALSFLDDPLNLKSDMITGLQILSGITGRLDPHQVIDDVITKLKTDINAVDEAVGGCLHEDPRVEGAVNAQLTGVVLQKITNVPLHTLIVDINDHTTHPISLDKFQGLDHHRCGSTCASLPVTLGETTFLVVLDSHPRELNGWQKWLALGCLDGSDGIAALAFRIAVEAFLGTLIIVHQVIEDPIECLGVPDVPSLQFIAGAHRPSVLSVWAVAVVIREWQLSTHLIDGAVSFKIRELRLQRMSLKLSGAELKREPTDLGKELLLTVLGLSAIDDGKRDFFAGIGHVSKHGHEVEVAVEIETCDTAVRTVIGHV
jgi:hypothetical protein